MGLNVVQSLIESQLSGTMTAGKREDAPEWRRALTIDVRVSRHLVLSDFFFYSTFRDHPDDQ